METNICWYDGKPCNNKICAGSTCLVYKAAISH